MAIEKMIQYSFHEELKCSLYLNIPANSGLFIKCFVIVKRYTDQVIP